MHRRTPFVIIAMLIQCCRKQCSQESNPTALSLSNGRYRVPYFDKLSTGGWCFRRHWGLIACLLLLSVCQECLGLTIADAKRKADGEMVTLQAKSITLASADYLYIEDLHVSGMRVNKAGHGFTSGMVVDVTGSMQTSASGERCIAATQISRSGTAFTPLEPLYMNNRALGGDNWHWAPGATNGQRGVKDGLGANNVGLLVRVAGRVRYNDPSGAFLYIDDGSGLDDGNTLGAAGTAITGIRVLLSAGVSVPPADEHIAVTGISSTATVAGMTVRALVLYSYIGDFVTIPAGSFLMGNSGVGNDLQQGYPHEKPQHSVYLSEYQIGRTEVTRGDYRLFMYAGGYTLACRQYWSDAGWAWRLYEGATQPEDWGPRVYLGDPPGWFTQTERHPLAGINYYEAEAFCNWAGYHLPTEAQWENAARWSGSPGVYPWGSVWDPQKCNCFDDGLYPGYQTAPIGSYPAGISPYGCLDIAGNVLEWCRDWYSGTYYSQTPPGGWVDPRGPTAGSYRVIRGGCWYDSSNPPRCAYRDYSFPDHVCYGWLNAGCRVAR